MRTALLLVVVLGACAAPAGSGPLPAVDGGKGDGALEVVDMGKLLADTWPEADVPLDTAHLYHFVTMGPGRLEVATLPSNDSLNAGHLEAGQDGNARTRVVLYRHEGDVWEQLDEASEGGAGGWSELHELPVEQGEYAVAVVGEAAGRYRVTWDCVGTACTPKAFDNSCRVLDILYTAGCPGVPGAEALACAEAQDPVSAPLTAEAHVAACCVDGPFAAVAPYCR